MSDQANTSFYIGVGGKGEKDEDETVRLLADNKENSATGHSPEPQPDTRPDVATEPKAISDELTVPPILNTEAENTDGSAEVNKSDGKVNQRGREILEKIINERIAFKSRRVRPASRLGSHYEDTFLVSPDGGHLEDNLHTTPGDSSQMYVELEELSYVAGIEEWVWLQKSRWIKYEEDIELETQRWGTPHVPFLSNSNLVELKDVFKKAVVLLDDPASTMEELSHSVAGALVEKGLLTSAQADLVEGALALPHKLLDDKDHAHYYKGGHSGGKTTDHKVPWNLPASMQSSSSINRRKSREEASSDHRKSPRLPKPRAVGRSMSAVHFSDNRMRSFSANADLAYGGENRRVQTRFSAADFRDDKRRDHHPYHAITSHLEKDASGTVVLTGHLKELTELVMTVVRLTEGLKADDMIGANVPFKFVFVIFGPPLINSQPSLHETGRSVGTLMANKRFQTRATQAKDGGDLLAAVTDFLAGSFVVPPGHWDKDQLIPSILNAKSLRDEKMHGTLAFSLPIEPGQDEEYTKPQEELIHDLYDLKIAKPGSVFDIESEERDFDDNPLQRTKRLFGGLINDVKRRYPKYVSDIKDGLNPQCIATLFFLYFACLAPAITFGGLLGAKTSRYMGISEMLIGISACGVMFHLLSAQPLMVIGTTGPVLVFEESLYSVSMMVGWEYISFRFWVCFWLFVVTLLVVMFEGSFLVKYITTFTEEIFAFLISLIFIFEVFNKLYRKYPMIMFYPYPWVVECQADVQKAEVNLTMTPIDQPSAFATVISESTLEIMQTLFNSSILDTIPNNISEANYTCSRSFILDTSGPLPNTALLSMVLTLGTFVIAYYFRLFRHMHFLGKTARRVLADFGIPIAILVMVVLDLFIHDVYTEKLDVPGGLSVTNSEKRGWFINPLGVTTPLPYVAMFAAVVPAILVFILIFMETQITSIIVNKRLSKGSGFHLDLMLIGLFSILCGTFGLPLLSFATVRAITHVNALCVYSRVVPPGDSPKLVEVKEQRLTGIFAHILIGASVLMGPVLRAVPLSVLFGVFLYMGITSLVGMQLTERLVLLMKPVKHHPPVPYVTKVRPWKMHLFTMVQVLFLTVLWAVKSSPASLAFPFVLILAIPVRMYLLKYIFTERELRLLDMKEGEIYTDEDDDDP